MSTCLENLLTCNLKQLPAEFFLHRFWSLLAAFMPSWKPYLGCLRKAGLRYCLLVCASSSNISKVCPRRFGNNLSRSYICKRYLWDDDAATPNTFKDYKQCVDKKLETASKCVALMRHKCEENDFRATKLVRGTMGPLGTLLERRPNLRIIHLVRDPRAVTLSRLSSPTIHGIYAHQRRNKIALARVREAEVYCSTLRRDLQVRSRLEQSYPGRVVQIVYDDFVQRPVEYAQAVYQYLGLKMPNKLTPWVAKHTKVKGGKKSEGTKIPRWKSIMTIDEIKKINQICWDIPELVGYKWRDWDLGEVNVTAR